jgi:flagellar motor component MotA
VPNACEGEPLHTALGAFESALALEDAMKRVARYRKTLPRTFDKKAEEVYQLAQAAGIISKTEYEGLLAFEKMKYELIMTDDFSFNEFARKGAV